jgi:capsular exopolysaccharide synthesis family protein
LRTNLAFSSIDTPIRSIVVTSGAGGDGKSTVAANLAVVLAQEGRKVLLVDADLRRPTLHDMFRTSQAVGLTSLLNHPEMTLSHVSFATEVEGLRLITSGVLPPNPVELLGSHRMEAVMKDLVKAADIVIIDTPPTGPVSDAVILSGLVDGVLLVAASRKTRAPSLRRASEATGRALTRVIGVVLNGVGRGVDGTYYGYNLTEANRAAPEVAQGITTAAPVTTRKG